MCLRVSSSLYYLSSHSSIYATYLPVFVWAALWQSAHSAYPVVFPLFSGKMPLSWKLASSVEFVYTFE